MSVQSNDQQSGSIAVGDILVIICDPGFTLDGEMMLTCMESGRLSDEYPACRRKLKCMYLITWFTKITYS